MPTLPHRSIIGQSWMEYKEQLDSTFFGLLETIIKRTACKHLFEKKSFGHSGVVDPGVRTYPCSKCGLKEFRQV